MTAHLSAALDDEDAFRLAKVETEVLGLRQRALRTIPDFKLLSGGHRSFVRYVCGMAPEKLSDAQKDQVHRLCWLYRRSIPAHLAPKCNPDDPVVAEARRRERAGGDRTHG